MNPADRKKQLIAQGAIYRAEVILARQAAKESLRPASLARSALQPIALAAFAAFKRRSVAGLPGINLRTLLPLFVSGVSALSKRKPLLKTIMRGAVIAGVAAGVVALISRKKKTAQDTATVPADLDA